MTCKVVAAGPGMTVIVCSRGSRQKHCSTAGCRGYEVALCDYPLTGGKAGETCSRSICPSCRRPQSPGIDFCPVHHAIKKASKAGL
jgi:hypothetical protein